MELGTPPAVPSGGPIMIPSYSHTLKPFHSDTILTLLRSLALEISPPRDTFPIHTGTPSVNHSLGRILNSILTCHQNHSVHLPGLLQTAITHHLPSGARV